MIGVIIQARTGSTRYPRKIYEDINGKSTLARVIEGVSKAQLPHKIILAMPGYDQDEFISSDLAKTESFSDDRLGLYFGHADDLVDRYFQAARLFDLDLIVRVTADCPLVQGSIIDEMLLEYLKNGYNGYMGNNSLISSAPHPEGTDVEIFKYWMLAETWMNSKDPDEREHCTPYMYSGNKPYEIHEFKNIKPNTTLPLKFKDFSFDTKEDYELLLKLTKEYDKHEDLAKAIKDTEL